jgi:hypothetical protein
MLHWQNPHSRTWSHRLPFYLSLVLLFYIQIETTIIARGYTYLLGLNATSTDALARTSGVAQSAQTATRALGMLTISLPCLIWITSSTVSRRTSLSSIAIRLGLCLWLGGAAISTLAHIENPLIMLNFLAGIGSAAAVFYAIRSLRIANLRQVEAMLAAIFLGALIPAIQGIIGYYQAWGIPSVQTLLAAKYQPRIWQSSAPFGNPDNVATLYCLLACPCLAVVSSRVFGRKMRLLALVMLVCAGMNLLLTMARASLIIFVVAFAAVNMLMHNRKVRLLSAVAIFLVIFSPAVNSPMMRDYFGVALRVDALADNSVAERLDSIRISWQHFLENPVIGVGAYQSTTFLAEQNAHELPIWQAAEHGILGLLGVLLVTAGSVGRFLKLLKSGCGRDQVSLQFIFVLGPSMYFAKGLFAEVSMNNIVVNTWICTAFAMLAIADSLTWDPSPAKVPLRTYYTCPAPQFAFTSPR